MKKWKRVIAVLCALVCILGVSVPAFAAVTYTTFSEAKISDGSLLSASYGDAVRLDTAGNLVVNISFDASTWSKIDEAKELWRTVMSEWNGNPDYYIFYQFARSYLYVGAFSKSSFSHISNKTDMQGTYHAYFRQGCTFRFELRNSVLRLTSHAGSLLEGSLQDVALFPSSKNLYFFYKSIVDFQEEHSFSTTVSVLSDINNVTIIDDVVSPPEIPQYSLIVNYQYENGTQAAQPVTRSLTTGSSYEITSPTIKNYTADRVVVSGIMPERDLTVHVLYRKDSSGSSKPSGWFDAAPDVEWKDPFEWFDAAPSVEWKDPFAWFDAAPNVEWKDPFTWFDAAPNVEWWSPFPWGG